MNVLTMLELVKQMAAWKVETKTVFMSFWRPYFQCLSEIDCTNTSENCYLFKHFLQVFLHGVYLKPPLFSVAAARLDQDRTS